MQNPRMNTDAKQPTTTWEKEAARILRGELARFGLDKPKDLRAKLAELGVLETERNLTNKISRGKFSFVFFLQCMYAAGVASVRVEIEEELGPARNRKRAGREVPEDEAGEERG
jgi:hypothetical protein